MGRAHARSSRPTSPWRSRRSSTTSWWCAARSSRRRPPGPTATSSPASTSSCAGPPGGGPGGSRASRWCSRDRSSISARPSGRVGDGAVRRGRDDPGPDRRPGRRPQAAAGVPEQVRPCILCNQTCQVRDARNPIVSCVGRALVGPRGRRPLARARRPRRARPARSGGARRRRRSRRARGRPRGRRSGAIAVLLVEAAARVGGGPAVAAAGGGRERLVELVRLARGRVPAARGGHRHRSRRRRPRSWPRPPSGGAGVVLATGSIDGVPGYTVDEAARPSHTEPWNFLSSLDSLARPRSRGRGGGRRPDRRAHRRVVAETVAAKGRDAHLVTPDNIVGNELARTGDLAPANVRLQQAGVHIERRSIVRAVTAPASVPETVGGAVGVEVDDRFTGERRTIAAGLVVDAGFRLPDEALWRGPAACTSGPATASRRAPSTRPCSKAAGPSSPSRRGSHDAPIRHCVSVDGCSATTYGRAMGEPGAAADDRALPLVAAAPRAGDGGEPHRVQRPPHQLRRGRPAHRAARRLLRRAGQAAVPGSSSPRSTPPTRPTGPTRS